MKNDRCLEILKKANLKVTPKRRAVIRFFLQNRRYFTPKEIWTALKRNFEHLGLPTIYRNLRELEDIGILVRISRPEQQLYYAICHLGKEREHHHFVCQKCGRVSEVEFCNFKNIDGDIEKKLNCKIISHFTQIEGLCSECKRRKDEKRV